MQTIKCEGQSRPVRINEGKEKGNSRNITTQRPRVQPAPQPVRKPEKKD